MKPSQINQVLDLAMRAREQNNIFNPLFVGAPGLGKSQIVQQWCKNNSLPFIDLRAAYLEAPDLIGYPSIEKKSDGRQVTVHNIPEFWPSEGKGVLLLEEPNRGTTSIMNTFMQILTDRKVHKYELPKGWIIVGCINPENEEYDVNTMDPALKDRFEIFTIEYDRKDHVQYMKDYKYDSSVVSFVETNTWVYKKPEDIGKTDGNKYIAPRTLSKLDAAIKADLKTNEMEQIVYQTILGKNVGMTFYAFQKNEQPVMFKEIKSMKTRRDALEKLNRFCDPTNYKAGSISITVRDIVDDNTIDDELLIEVIFALSADGAYSLLKELDRKRPNAELLKKILSNAKVKKHMRDVLV